MTEIKQCWAFHRDGARCEHPAGHAGDHMVEKSWNDLQCATPGEFHVKPEPATSNHIQVSDTVEPTIVMPVIVKPSCVACGHKHRDGECRCGCHEFIG